GRGREGELRLRAGPQGSRSGQRPGALERGRPEMASNGKKKTTMAKLNRESKLREKRLDKQMRKEDRKRAAAEGPTEEETTDVVDSAPEVSIEEAMQAAL